MPVTKNTKSKITTSKSILENIENIGSFYLGKEYSLPEQEVTEEIYAYDSKDLTTHAMCVGMTGSGKTGLCISMLEEALLDGIPVIAIDPKGDLSNLALNFPKLDGPSFEPWVDPGAAQRKGQSPEAFAQGQAELWKKGLASWGQGSPRLRKLKESAHTVIYTPGHDAGRKISVLNSFAKPKIDSPVEFQDHIANVISGLMHLLGEKSDSLSDPNQVFLSHVFNHLWKQSDTIDFASLVREIQNPSFERVGVMTVDSFISKNKRQDLALKLNALFASPSFEFWLQGDPLDISSLLWDEDGKPKVSIFSIAHLREEERMFFVSILLNQIVAWLRSQSGTSSLRAILYMDEVFGYLPPTAMPPSKKPFLTLLKQARAYGLGLCLATQNPADLDYKALSNMGTWFLGRLQTQRDKDKVLEGLKVSGGTGDLSAKEMDEFLSALPSRVFLAKNVHEKEISCFHTRWAMSYLRGPLTLDHIRKLTPGQPEKVNAKSQKSQSSSVAAPRAVELEKGNAEVFSEAPLISDEISQVYIKAIDPSLIGARIAYQASVLGEASAYYSSKKYGVNESRSFQVLWSEIENGELKPEFYSNSKVEYSDSDPMESVPYLSFAKEIKTDEKNFSDWEKKLKKEVYRNAGLALFEARDEKMVSKPGETQLDFQARVQNKRRELRDENIEEIKERFAKKIQGIQRKIQKAEEKVEKERSQYQQSKIQAAVSLGATVLGALLGRRALSSRNVGRVGTTLRGAGRISKEKREIELAKEGLEWLNEDIEKLEEEMKQEIAEVSEVISMQAPKITEISLRPLKKDIDLGQVHLAWKPVRN